ncbi:MULTISPECIES: hypothetical protein [unclassified Nostoc]|nr:hypothetical protein [Nostoc sp. S13]MDF5737537.1 hypothetical protein [Nostoc sp. S13]
MLFTSLVFFTPTVATRYLGWAWGMGTLMLEYSLMQPDRGDR